MLSEQRTRWPGKPEPLCVWILHKRPKCAQPRIPHSCLSEISTHPHQISGRNLHPTRARKTLFVIMAVVPEPDRAINTLNQEGNTTDPDLWRFLSPLGGEHINLTGSHTWPRVDKIKPGKHGPLPVSHAGNGLLPSPLHDVFALPARPSGMPYTSFPATTWQKPPFPMLN